MVIDRYRMKGVTSTGVGYKLKSFDRLLYFFENITKNREICMRVGDIERKSREDSLFPNRTFSSNFST